MHIRLQKLRTAHDFAGVGGGGAGASVSASVSTFVDHYTGPRMHGPLGLDKRTPGRRLWVPTPVPGVAEQKAGIRHHGFNATLSESLPLDRTVLDKRARQCAADTRNYPPSLAGLPDTTVIFVFVNEEKSVLLRSIHSVLNRSPPELLKEIILVDDGSDEAYITGGVDIPGSLAEYVCNAFVHALMNEWVCRSPPPCG